MNHTKRNRETEKERKRDKDREMERFGVRSGRWNWLSFAWIRIGLVLFGLVLAWQPNVFVWLPALSPRHSLSIYRSYICFVQLACSRNCMTRSIEHTMRIIVCNALYNMYTSVNKRTYMQTVSMCTPNLFQLTYIYINNSFRWATHNLMLSNGDIQYNMDI